jgi:hypothetical protein
MRIRPRKILVCLLGVMAAAYLSAAAVLYEYQRDFLYRPAAPLLQPS